MCIHYVANRFNLSYATLLLCFSLTTSCVLADDLSQPRARLNPEVATGSVSNGVSYPGMPTENRYRIVRNRAAGTQTISRQDIVRIDEVVQVHNRELEGHWLSLHEMLSDLADTDQMIPVFEVAPNQMLSGSTSPVLLSSNIQTGMVWKRWGVVSVGGSLTERFAYFHPETRERSSELSRGNRAEDSFFSDKYSQHIDGRDSWITKMSDGSGSGSVLVHHVVRSPEGILVRDKFFREGRGGEEIPLWK